MTDITSRQDIILLIDTFYKKAIHDEVIGYFFTEVVQLDFEKHMPKMYDFWESTLFHLAIYKGNPMAVHQALYDKSPLKKEHYQRWLQLFNQTVEDLFEGEKATLAKQRGLSIAIVMEMKLK